MIQTLVALIVFFLIVLIVISVRRSPKDLEDDFRRKAEIYLKEAETIENVTRERIIVAGIEYRKEAARSVLKQLKEGDAVELSPEPENPYDCHAVKVCVKGVHVGYIPRYLSKEIFDNFLGIYYAEVAGVIDFTETPSLYLNIALSKKKGLSDEAVNFFLEHQDLLNKDS